MIKKEIIISRGLDAFPSEMVFKVRLHEYGHLNRIYGKNADGTLSTAIRVSSTMWHSLTKKPFVRARMYSTVYNKAVFEDLDDCWSFSEEIIKDIDFMDSSALVLSYV
jgi:hypothetical protein